MSWFYRDCVGRLLQAGELTPDSSLLVVCAGPLDRETLLALGFRTVLLCGLDQSMEKSALEPYGWARQDAEHLGYPDQSFDYALVHAGLHHCHSPHRALLEMLRVARRGVLALEARDSFTMRVACWFKLALDYELTAVAMSPDGRSGGVRNGPVPNYVYRWTEREVVKTVCCAAPQGRPRIRFFHGLELPYEVVGSYSPARRVLLQVLSPLLAVYTWLFRGQGNRFGFFVRKAEYPRDLQPWLTDEGDGPRLVSAASRAIS